MSTEKTPWEGRLGIEVMGKMHGCCVGTITKWRPQVIGEKKSCSYCGSYLKTIRAGEVLSPVFTGGMLEHHRDVVEPELTIGGLYFASGRFPTEEAVKAWMGEREMQGEVAKVDEHAFYLPIDDSLMADSVRLIWVAPGVVGELGVSEKQVATGGGQASMSSPGITTTSIASGGDLFPSQAPAAAAAEVPGVPSVIQGITDVQDGHQHEYFLTPTPEVGGWRVKSFTSYNNGHAHMIECAIGPSGEIDTRTAPDQTPVGGHAHSHRLSWPVGKSFGEEKPYEKQYRVTSGDVVLLRRAAGMVDNFCKNIQNGRSVLDSASDFQAQLSSAIERARGQVAGVDGVVVIKTADIERLQGCAKFIDEMGDGLAVSIGMEKSLEKAKPGAKADALAEVSGKKE